MDETINRAIQLFNETWDLLDKTDRTTEDDITMLHKTHTSAFLWRTANKPVNNARGEWQVSHVYSVLKYGAPALLHGESSLALCLENGIGGLDLAFGYEAVARAHSVLGDAAKSAEFKQKGIDASADVSDAEDRAYVLGELNSIE
ncbi:MAG: hypothetical protein LBN02_07870 [Oscillospiraceae bacterium]|jgi:hypothetical protein|nr:hypothetical protein [Oscillospiraceae bacterium]